MTKELAIKVLTGDVLGTTEQTHEAVAMAIKALSALPSADVTDTNLGNNDLINRQVANEYFDLYRHSVLSTDEITSMIPTAVADVVRCKDCKWYVVQYDIDGDVPYWKCNNWDAQTDADGFCYEAEMR